MTDLMSAIQDDIDHYKQLCIIYNEDIKYTRDAYQNLVVDCYGPHAESLRQKYRKEISND